MKTGEMKIQEHFSPPTSLEIHPFSRDVLCRLLHTSSQFVLFFKSGEMFLLGQTLGIKLNLLPSSFFLAKVGNYRLFLRRSRRWLTGWIGREVKPGFNQLRCRSAHSISGFSVPSQMLLLHCEQSWDGDSQWSAGIVHFRKEALSTSPWIISFLLLMISSPDRTRNSIRFGRLVSADWSNKAGSTVTRTAPSITSASPNCFTRAAEIDEVQSLLVRMKERTKI